MNILGWIISGVNKLISGVGEGILLVLNLLPDSPWSDPAKAPDTINLGYVTWAIPFPTMLAHLALLLTAIGVYYVVRVLARWIKVARD